MIEHERPALPAALRAVAYFTIVVGIGNALTMLVSLSKGHLNINIGVLQIPSGFGILRLSRGWRTFQLWMLWIGMITFGLGFVIVLMGWTPTITDYGSFIRSRSREVTAVVCALMFALEFWQYRVLTGREARLLFGLTVLSRARRPGGLRGGPGKGADPDGFSSGLPPRT